MSFNFNQIPPTNFSPGVHTEFDPSGAPGVTAPRKVLLIGYDHPASAGAQEEPKPIGAASEWHRKAQISSLIRAYRRIDETSSVDAIAVAEPDTGTAADVEITMSGTATEGGVLAVYIAGKLIEVGVASGDTADNVAAAIAAAVEADLDVPVTAAAVGPVVTLTAAFKGSEGNRLAVAIDPKSSQNGVAGVSPSLSALTFFTGGAGTPDLAATLSLVTDERYYAIVSGFSDGTSLTSLAQDFAARWSATNEKMGQGIAGISGTQASMEAEMAVRNDEELTLMNSGQSTSPAWEAAAQAAAYAALKSNPATGWEGFQLLGLDAPPLASRPDKGEREALLRLGISTFRVDGSTMVLDQLVTTKTADSSGDPDFSALLLTRRLTIQFLRENLRSRLSTKFRNFSLADEPDVEPRNGLPILTPALLISELIAWFKEMRDVHGLTQGINKYKAIVAAAVNGDPNRLDAFNPPKLVRQLVTIGVLFQPR
ncbi:MAG: phage tail sheath subtilisin-like domain-containing protein [Myxococcota bacterium]